MARLTKADMLEMSEADLLKVPQNERPISRRGVYAGNAPNDRSWRTRILNMRKDGAKRGASDIETELGTLAPPKVEKEKPPSSRYKAGVREGIAKRTADATKLAQSFGISPQSIALQLEGGHKIASLLLREPAIALPDADEAAAMGKAIYDCLIRYDMVWLFEHTPLLVMVTTLGTVEYNTLARVRAAREAKLRTVNAVAPQRPVAPSGGPTVPLHVVPTPPAGNGNMPMPPDPAFARAPILTTLPDEPPFAARSDAPLPPVDIPQAAPREDTEETPNADV
jgi:hypothetical protein